MNWLTSRCNSVVSRPYWYSTLPLAATLLPNLKNTIVPTACRSLVLLALHHSKSSAITPESICIQTCGRHGGRRGVHWLHSAYFPIFFGDHWMGVRLRICIHSVSVWVPFHSNFYRARRYIMSGKGNHDAKRFKLKQRQKRIRKKNLLNEQQTSTRLQTTAPSVPAARDVLIGWLNTTWYPEHTGRRQCESESAMYGLPDTRRVYRIFI